MIRENIKTHIGDLIEMLWHGLLVFIPFGIFLSLTASLIKAISWYLHTGVWDALAMLGIILVLHAMLFINKD